jgi:hypothetical protein
MPGLDFKALKARSQKAWGDRDRWTKVLLDAYDYIAPYRMSTRLYEKAPGNRTDKIFDNTGSMALVRSAGRLQQDLFPPGVQWFELEPGPGVKAAGGDPEQVAQELQQLTQVIWPTFLTGEWDMALIEMLFDVLISTGFMMILKGDEMKPVRFVSASMDEVAVDQGPYASIDGVFWKRKWPLRGIMETWPHGNYPEAMKASAVTSPEDTTMLLQDTVSIDNGRSYQLWVYTENAEAPIWTETSLTNPWITPRYFRMPGQAYGFGPALLTLPTIKTLNKAQEFTLKAAALAMSGIFTRIDDGVFNPDLARIEPGAMWTVERNGGVLGPSIARLDIPGNMNVSNIVLQDLRQQVNSGMFEQSIPPDANSPKSASEIVMRLMKLAQDHAGAYGRLINEIVLPAVPRIIEILHSLGAIKTRIRIDQLLVMLKVTSPLAQAFNAGRIQPRVEFMQLVQSLAGPQALSQMMPVNSVLASIGKAMGIAADEIYPQSVQQQMMQTVQMLVQQGVQAALKQMQQQQAPPSGDPAQAGQQGPMQ